jgi:1-acyl-sn-glycerol-3-phosphate acyltransferase
MEEPQKIEVRSVLASKSPRLAKRMPGFIIRYLERILHQDEINFILSEYGHLKDQAFVSAVLSFMGISYTAIGTDDLPETGRYIFASNHPLGGLDGLVFMDAVSKHYPSVKFPVNDLLLNLNSFSGIFLPVNKHGVQDREAVRAIDNAYASDDQILYFPAGICSRRKKGKISDLEWQKSFIAKAVWHRRDIIPVYFSGRNSRFFYSLANIRSLLGIKTNLEMLWLPDEMFRQKGKQIYIVFGKPVSWKTFDKTKSTSGWAAFMKKRSYDLESKIDDTLNAETTI